MIRGSVEALELIGPMEIGPDMVSLNPTYFSHHGFLHGLIKQLWIQIIADESDPTILRKGCRHLRLFESLERAFGAPSQQETTLDQHPLLVPLSLKLVEELGIQARTYIPLDIFREQTLHFEPFHLINGPGVV
jgi:hypothetical protein